MKKQGLIALPYLLLKLASIHDVPQGVLMRRVSLAEVGDVQLTCQVVDRLVCVHQRDVGAELTAALGVF